MHSFKKPMVMIGLSIFVFIFIAAQTAPADDKPKNLKVLPKNISPRDLDKLMDKYCDALGVNCEFCHTRNKQTEKMDFAKDTKPEKEIARNMMRMTNGINKTYFKFTKTFDPNEVQAISCMTCHRKQPRPELDSFMNKIPENK